MIGTILACFAFVFAAIAALFITEINRSPFAIHFGWLALAFWVLADLLGGVHGFAIR